MLLELLKYIFVIRKNICVISVDQFAVLSPSSSPRPPVLAPGGTMTAVQEPAAGSADVHQLLAELAALRERLAHVEASAQGVEAALAYLATAAPTPAPLEALRPPRLGSAATVALPARGHRLGALPLLTGEGRPRGEAEVALAEELAVRAAMALDTARLHEASQRAKSRL